MNPSGLILDVQEKEVAAPKLPSFPQLNKTSPSTGFPEHKKRTSRISAFKQKRQGPQAPEQVTKIFTTSSNEPLRVDDETSNGANDADRATPGTGGGGGGEDSFDAREQRRIDRENNDKLASMSPEEIEAARRELFGGLDPKTLEMLLRRANIDDPNAGAPSPFDAPPGAEGPPAIHIEDTSKTKESKKVRFQSTVEDETSPDATSAQKPASSQPTPQPPQAHGASSQSSTTTTSAATDTKTGDSAPSEPPTDQISPPSTSSATTTTAESSTPEPKPHWPPSPQPPDLDPNDPDFLSALHAKYFPSLPADPTKLAWMAPIPTPNSPADYDSPYHPNQSSFPVATLRFDFRGTLLPPRISRAVPMSKGLHHHGEAPEAAGYTVAELARLTRSAVPGQRCIAYQTLGRILFRLGRGEFGGGPSEDAPAGIWRQMEEGAVMRSIYEEAGTEEGRGHRSARAFAIEAIWLFEKGGWGERLKKGR